ncbi:hypothetical protein QUA83_21670 [Microcoleus sp. K1-B1]
MTIKNSAVRNQLLVVQGGFIEIVGDRQSIDNLLKFGLSDAVSEVISALL